MGFFFTLGDALCMGASLNVVALRVVERSDLKNGQRGVLAFVAYR